MCGLVLINDEKIKEESLALSLEKLHHRGPDHTSCGYFKSVSYGFKRLAIMDQSHQGDQPFFDSQNLFMCNGEIYNHKVLREKYSDFTYQSQSDCEVLIPLYNFGSIESVVEEIDGEYALVIYDSTEDQVFAARDPMGIRPLFYGHTDGGKVCFASEAKALMEFCKNIKPFPPGHYYKGNQFYCFKDLARDYKYHDTDDLDIITKNINKLLVEAVKKRLDADAPIGFLLSGGLDSSLVCSIAQKFSDKKIKTFAIGMSEDAIDLKYAKEVADHIKSDHTEVIITREQVIKALNKVIYHLESWDITTVRASVGMYLICEYIQKNTDIKVLMTGEVSDEIFGYKYTDFAPSANEFQKEAQKRVGELYLYDVLRADRCISAHSLEARVPFSDNEFVEYVMGIDPLLKMNTYKHGKYLLRKAFQVGDYLPESILFREKAAFSDAVGHSLVECLKEYAQSIYTDDDFNKRIGFYHHAMPFTKESLLYRDIFHQFYPLFSHLIPSYWMPNKNWKNCDVKDPSARVLPNYGASGV